MMGRIYNPIVRPMDRFGLRHFREWATAHASGKVLEIGVGTALNASYYPPQTEFIIGFDPDASMLEAIEEHHPHLSLTVARAEELPFPDEYFDSAVGTLVFCTVPDAAKGLSEVKRVLKRGASLRLVEHVAAHNAVLRGIQTALNPVYRPLAGGCNLNRHTLSQVERAGWKIESVRERVAGIVMAIEAVKP